MGKKGIKKYVRVCTNYHSQFENFRLPIGAIYGRVDQVYFVSLYRRVKNGKVKVYVKDKNGNNPDKWEYRNISTDCMVWDMILDCIEKNGAPIVGRYDSPRKPKTAFDSLERISINGKKYRVIPSELELPDIRIDKELKGIAPDMRKSGEFTAKRMRPDNTQYGVEYNGKLYLFFEYDQAEQFCNDHWIDKTEIKQEFLNADSTSEIGNEISFWKVYKDMPRRLGWSKEKGMYV